LAEAFYTKIGLQNPSLVKIEQK